MRKLSCLSVALLLFSSLSYAQLINKVLPPIPFVDSLTKVVESYQNNYQQIQGLVLTPDEDRDIFESTVALPGASSCKIFRFHSEEDTTASWQAILFEGEDFKEASKAYKNAFKHLKQTNFKVGDQKISFQGQMESPTEELRFTTSILKPTIYTEPYKNFIAEVEMLGSIEGWTVRLNLHSRKKDTERYQ